jgi:lipopolysaccharide/colanic/teichoic acid biosynthesis glycosyltransferase
MIRSLCFLKEVSILFFNYNCFALIMAHPNTCNTNKIRTRGPVFFKQGRPGIDEMSFSASFVR